MNSDIWKRFPVIKGFRCLDMKDRAQAKVVEDTRRATPMALIAYFRDASRHFWQEAGRAYPERSATPLTIREKDDRASKG